MSRVPHVCLVTEMPLVLDGRILNQAFTLSRAGYAVTVVDQSIPRRPDGLASLQARLPAWLAQTCRVVRLAAGDAPFSAGVFVALHKHARPLARRLVSRTLVQAHADVYQARSLETLRTVVPRGRSGRGRCMTSATSTCRSGHCHRAAPSNAEPWTPNATPYGTSAP
jgi:hypothetical protein